MADLYNLNYDPRLRSGTSGAEVSDLNPEQAYDTDLRRVDPEVRRAVEGVNNKQERVGRFIKAAKTAGKYRQAASIDEPTIRGKTPRGEASIDGTTLPNLGDRFGRGGGVNYANKPTSRFGRSF
jgi:hypothetical protein